MVRIMNTVLNKGSNLVYVSEHSNYLLLEYNKTHLRQQTWLRTTKKWVPQLTIYVYMFLENSRYLDEVYGGRKLLPLDPYQKALDKVIFYHSLLRILSLS